jgi:hypothetical protein
MSWSQLDPGNTTTPNFIKLNFDGAKLLKEKKTRSQRRYKMKACLSGLKA